MAMKQLLIKVSVNCYIYATFNSVFRTAASFYVRTLMDEITLFSPCLCQHVHFERAILGNGYHQNRVECCSRKKEIFEYLNLYFKRYPCESSNRSKNTQDHKKKRSNEISLSLFRFSVGLFIEFLWTRISGPNFELFMYIHVTMSWLENNWLPFASVWATLMTN